MTIASVLWRRLDTPGHDACRLERVDAGWRLDGAATFRHEEVPTCLAYRVTCDAAWLTREGSVNGWVGARAVDLVVRRTADGVWSLNETQVPDLDGCVDLDLGFTPATNLLQIRRIALIDGQAADVPVAWLEVPGGTLSILHWTPQLTRRAQEASGARKGARQAPRPGLCRAAQAPHGEGQEGCVETSGRYSISSRR